MDAKRRLEALEMQKKMQEFSLLTNKRNEIDEMKAKRKENASSGAFSGKQKKKQLREKKKRTEKRKEELDALTEVNVYEDFFSENSAPPIAELTNSRQQHNLQLTVALGRSRDDVDRQLSSFFVKETKEQIHMRIMEGQVDLDTSKISQPILAQELARDPVLDHPKRPKWSYRSTKKQVDDKESVSFDSWLEKIHSKYQPEELNHFEHNLEVWREFWRVLERSTHIVLVADIRNPLLHIPPSVYDHVTEELKKPLLVVLNKTDLIPKLLIQEWVSFLRNRFPLCKFLLFSSRSNAVYGEQNIAFRRRLLLRTEKSINSEILKFAENILTSCGVGSEKATTVIRDMNVYDESELENIVEAKKKNRRGKRRKNRNLEGNGESEMLLCDHCGSDDVAVSCTSCGKGFDPLLICSRCSKEAHNDPIGKSHNFINLDKNRHDDNFLVDSLKPTFTIGLIGHPNVGKSSVLNSLAGKKIVSVSHTPGHTKRLQTIMIDPDICICDCPGLVFPFVGVPKYLQELNGLYPYAQTREPYSAVRFLGEHLELEKLLSLKPRTQLFEGVEEISEWSPYTICEAFAEKKGYRTDRRGRPDHHKAGIELIRDCVDGVVPLYTYPPCYSGPKILKETEESIKYTATPEADNFAATEAPETELTGAPLKALDNNKSVNSFSLLVEDTSEEESSDENSSNE